MDRKLTIRPVFCAVVILAACLVSSGCRSAESPSGLMGVSSLVDPVPPQWEPKVKTLAPPAAVPSDDQTRAENEETSSFE